MKASLLLKSSGIFNAVYLDSVRLFLKPERLRLSHRSETPL